ncbi:hypothetical protein B7463_g12612, partial [Scytalidium lignicola]
MESCIIYQDESKTISVIDVPRSIELAQGQPTTDGGVQRVILSSDPLEKPYPSVEPKSAKALSRLEPPPLSDLVLRRYIQLALEKLRETHQGPCHLPRFTAGGWSGGKRKREHQHEHELEQKHEYEYENEDSKETQVESSPRGDSNDIGVKINSIQYASRVCSPLYKNEGQSPTYITCETRHRPALIPPKATFLHGNIEDTLALFSQNAPQFNLILMDPPWPNRSARRKGSYGTSYDSEAINALLSSIPVKDHIEKDGIVAVWVTNKPAFREMLLAEGGLFDQWGIALVEEWVWLKVTSSGEPICELHSTWRKPYELLLVGRRVHADAYVDAAPLESVTRRLLIAIPDLHSRKPNLKLLFEPLLKPDFAALEIFARNLTTGWWAWGNEVLKFQTDEHLVQQSVSSNTHLHR